MTNEDKLRNIIKQLVKEEISQPQQETERESAMTNLRVTLEEWLKYIETDLERIPKYQELANEEISSVFHVNVQTKEVDECDNTIKFAALLPIQTVIKVCLETEDESKLKATYGDIKSMDASDVAIVAEDILWNAFYIGRYKGRVRFSHEGDMVEVAIEFPLLMDYCDLNYRIENLFDR